jgi:formylglycine-generating enzyme
VAGFVIADLWQAPPQRPGVLIGDGATGPRDMAWIPGGEFLMGSNHELAQPNEQPAHAVRVRGFWMDRTHVTNAQFRAFVTATGYRTTASLAAGAMVFVGTDAPVPLGDVSQWWRFVPGADWQHPRGPGSNIDGKDNHPAVQISYDDAVAYGKWIGKRLPTEAEWEFAARGGLEQATYAWGEEAQPGGALMSNIWDVPTRGHFPVVSTDAVAGTTRVGTFPPNGYGLVDMTGNAWQWTADWYRSDYFRLQAREHGTTPIDNPKGPAEAWDAEDALASPAAPRRVIRGGSFLCNVEYCQSYRPSARRGNDPANPMSHVGFRLVKDTKESGAHERH